MQTEHCRPLILLALAVSMVAFAATTFPKLVSDIRGEDQSEAEAQPLLLPLPDAIRERLDLAASQLTDGRFDEAVGTLESTLPMAQGHTQALCETLTWLGLAFKRLGSFHQSLDSYSRALELARSAGDRDSIGRILHNIGVCYTSLGELRLALDSFDEALELRESSWDQAMTLTAIATVHDLEGDHELAVAGLREALLLRKKATDVSGRERTRGLASALDRLGAALLNAGRIPAARRALESSNTLLGDTPYVTQRAIVELNLGSLLIEQGEPRSALALLEEAQLLLADRNRAPEQAIALLEKARAHMALGDLDLAADLLYESIELVESLRDTVPSPYLRSTFLASHRRIFELGIELEMRWQAQASRGLFHAVQALELAERSKARSLLDLLLEGSRSHRLAQDEALAVAVRSNERKLNHLEHERLTLLQLGAPTSQVAAIEKVQRSTILAHEALWTELGGEADHSKPPLAMELPEIRALLDPETRFLVYSLGDEASYLWMIGPESLTHATLPGRRALEAKARRGYQALAFSDQPGGRRPNLEAELGALLLPMEVGALEARRLVIIPDGVLHAIPFAALPDPRNGHPLIRDHEVVVVPSLSVLDLLRRRGAEQPSRPGSLAVLADPVYGPRDPRLLETQGTRSPALPTLERLEHSAREATEISRLVPGSKRLVRTGFGARREALLDGSLSSFQMIHLGIHGELVEDRPELTSLVFSRFAPGGQSVDGRLFMHEISSLDLPCELIVLSACSTALGKPIRGEGLVGLTQAVFLAGARRALVTLWNVDDEATAELMIRFYRGLLVEGLGPAAALREAQLTLPSLDPRWRAPYYWAGFVLQGDWHWPATDPAQN